jgi:predicted nucleic acid-binding protein
MTLAANIPDGATVVIDSNPIIYLFEGQPRLAPFESVFEAIDQGRIEALVTPITIAEVVAGPLRAGKEALAERYRRAITSSRGWAVRDVDADIAMLAARLRVRHRLKLPDAMQLAVAVHEGCFGLVSHDRDFSRVTDIAILDG